MFVDSGGFANAYQSGIRQGGAFELRQATWAYTNALKSPRVLADPQSAPPWKRSPAPVAWADALAARALTRDSRAGV